jgi:hypothetical protein
MDSSVPQNEARWFDADRNPGAMGNAFIRKNSREIPAAHLPGSRDAASHHRVRMVGI